MRVVRLCTALLLAVVVGGCSDSSETERAAPRIDGVVLADSDPSHDHTTARQDYDRSPPWGGPHWPPSEGGVRGWLTCGVHDAAVPDEFVVHSLEHGAVWLTYRPDVAEAAREPLRLLAGTRRDYALVSPYRDQPSPVVATAWGAQLAVDSPTDERLRAFVERYAGGDQGGEPGAPCAGGASPADAAAALERANR